MKHTHNQTTQARRYFKAMHPYAIGYKINKVGQRFYVSAVFVFNNNKKAARQIAKGEFHELEQMQFKKLKTAKAAFDMLMKHLGTTKDVTTSQLFYHAAFVKVLINGQ